jgi:hypothetical protein
MMRIAEILENITPVGSLAPDAYAAVAQQRNAAQRQKAAAAKQAHQQQQVTQQQALAKRRAIKPKPIKWRRKRIRKATRRSVAE